MFLNLGSFAPQEIFFGCVHLGDATGICWVEAEDAAELSSMHRTFYNEPSATENHPAPRISSAEVAELCFKPGADKL